MYNIIFEWDYSFPLLKGSKLQLPQFMTNSFLFHFLHSLKHSSFSWLHNINFNLSCIGILNNMFFDLLYISQLINLNIISPIFSSIHSHQAIDMLQKPQRNLENSNLLTLSLYSNMNP